MHAGTETGLFTHINTPNWFLHEWWTWKLQQTDSGGESVSVSAPWISRVILAWDLTELAFEALNNEIVSLASLSVQYVAAAAAETAHKSGKAASVN